MQNQAQQTANPVPQTMQVHSPAIEMNTFDILAITFDIIAITGLVTSILNFCVSVYLSFEGLTFVGSFFGIVSIVFSILGLESKKYKKLAITGIILSILSLIVASVIEAIKVVNLIYKLGIPI